MDFYKNDEIKAIFDISGGDIANGILPYIDYDVIASSSKLFWGTNIINKDMIPMLGLLIHQNQLLIEKLI